MRAGASFNPDQARWQGSEELQHLFAGQGLVYLRFAMAIHPMDLED